MAKIKKAQPGGKFTMDEAKRKRDSLDYDARLNMTASRNRTTRPGGSYDDISQELNRRAGKSDSLKTVFDKAIKKATPKKRAGGKVAKKSASKKK